MKSYTFHVSLPGTGRTWRKIEMPADYTLSHLHHAIQSAFRFSNDHLYSFFMSGKAWDSDCEYKLPEGRGPWEEGDPLSAEEAKLNAQEIEKHETLLREGYKQDILASRGPDFPESRLHEILDRFMKIAKLPGNVLTTRLGSLELKRKQTFMYLFDYGSEWRFKVRVHAINENADPEAEYPRIVESVGKAPQQYRSWDEEEE